LTLHQKPTRSKGKNDNENNEDWKDDLAHKQVFCKNNKKASRHKTGKSFSEAMSTGRHKGFKRKNLSF